MKKLELQFAFALTCTLVFGGLFRASAVQAQDGVTLLDLIEGATITVDDKRFSNWQLDDFTLGAGAFGSLDEILVTPLEDNPLNPGIKFSIPNGLGSGGTFAVLQFSFDVQTTSGEALIKDNSLWLNGFSIDPDSLANLVTIREFISDASGVSLGGKFVQAMAGDVANSGDPDHFDSAEFPPQSFVHVEKQVELLGDAVLTMFEQRFSQVPEPTSIALLAIVLLPLTWRRARPMAGPNNGLAAVVPVIPEPSSLAIAALALSRSPPGGACDESDDPFRARGNWGHSGVWQTKNGLVLLLSG